MFRCRACLPRLSVLAALIAIVSPTRADAPWLYGIHWYGDANGSVVEQMTGGKGIWSLETVMMYSDFWWQAPHQRDTRFNAMVQRGHHIIIRIQPNWGETVPFADRDMEQFLADLATTVQDLAGVTHLWQIGNEPNINGEWGGEILTPEYYADRYRQLRAVIKSVPSPLGEQLVLIGAPSPGEAISGVRHMDGNDYLAAVLDALDPAEVDGVTLHAYAAPWNSVANSRSEWIASLISQASILQSKGYGDKPIHVTEWNRRVDPISDLREAESAQFLHGAFTDLHRWNTTAGSLPISSACWFIYQFDNQAWAQYSILNLRNFGPPGADNDLFDAFQYAASLNYPAGQPNSEPPLLSLGSPNGPNIAGTAATTLASSGVGTNAVDGDIGSMWQTSSPVPEHWLELEFDPPQLVAGYTVKHAGSNGLSASFNTETFHIMTAPDPLSPLAIDGLFWNEGPAAETSVRYDEPHLVQRVRLVVTDPGRDARGRIPEFEVLAAPLPGDLDDDGDVDGDDWLRLAFCLAGPGNTFTAGHLCNTADFDGDRDVDLHDVWHYQELVLGD